MKPFSPFRRAVPVLIAALGSLAAPSAWSHSAFTWTGAANPVIRFTISGSADTATAPHSVTLTLITGTAAATSLVLDNPDEASAATILPSQLPWSVTNSLRRVTISKQADRYVLVVEKLPTTVPRGYMTDVTDWALTLNGLGAADSVQGSIGSVTRTLGSTSAAVLNVPPQVSITQPAASPHAVTAGQSVSFQAALDHPDRPVAYSWSLVGGGDPAGTDTDHASAVYRGATGDYVATVTATDDLTQSGSDTVTIHVTNDPPQPPVIHIEPDSATPFAEASRRFTASADDEIDTGPYAPTYTWTITNGTPATAPGASVDVAFNAAGPALVAVVARDNEGQTSSSSRNLEVWPKERLVVPGFALLPGNYSPPAIDGTITEGLSAGTRPDVSWKGATRVEYADGTTRDLAVQALFAPDGSGNRSLYLSFEVRDDASLDPTDVIVLAFRGPGAGSTPDDGPDPLVGDVALLVYPLSSSSAGSNLAADRVEVWRFGGSPGAWTRAWQTGDAGTGLAGLEIRSRIHGSALPDGWDTELKLPMRDLDAADAVTWPDFKDNFLLYWNLCRGDSATPGDDVAQFRWPREAPALTGVLSPTILRPSDWSGATTDASAVGRGVYIASPLDIGVRKDGILGNEIVIGGTNRFEATIRNSSLKVGGGGATLEGETAPKVIATFRIADWGTTYETATWQAVAPGGGSNNPTTPMDIPEPSNSVGHTDFDQPGSATVGFESAPLPAPASGNRHQCIYVELKSLSNVRIVNNKYYRNMNFVDASLFEDKARLDLGPNLIDPHTEGRFLLKVRRQVYRKDLRPLRPGSGQGTAPLAAPKKISTLVWTAHSFRDLGSTLVIRGKPFRVVEPSGSFGYYVRHEGAVANWKYELAGVKKLGKDLYEYVLPPPDRRPAGGVFLDAAIRPVEPRWLAAARGGAALPVGSTASDYGTGPAAALDFGAKAAGDFWLLGSLGYAGLEGKGATPDARWLNASLGLSYAYGFRSGFLIRGRLGAGWYRETSASAGDWGAEFGFDAEYELLPNLSAELCAAYRGIFDPAGTRFVTVAAGLVWKF